MHNVSLLDVLVETKDIYCQYHVAIILRADINVFPVLGHTSLYAKGTLPPAVTLAIDVSVYL